MDEQTKQQYYAYGGTPWLDGVHTVFGQVFDGMDTVDYISSSRVNQAGKPLDGEIVIQSIEISQL